MNRRRFLGALPFLYALPTMGWAGFAPSQPSSRYYRLAQYNGSWSLQAPRVLHPGSISHFGRPIRNILKTGKEFSFVDVWDSAFQNRIAGSLREDGRRFRRNSNLIGWIWTDSLPWDLAASRLSRETDWVSFIRQLPASCAWETTIRRFSIAPLSGGYPHYQSPLWVQLQEPRPALEISLHQSGLATAGHLPGRYQVLAKDCRGILPANWQTCLGGMIPITSYSGTYTGQTTTPVRYWAKP